MLALFVNSLIGTLVGISTLHMTNAPAFGLLHASEKVGIR